MTRMLIGLVLLGVLATAGAQPIPISDLDLATCQVKWNYAQSNEAQIDGFRFSRTNADQSTYPVTNTIEINNPQARALPCVRMGVRTSGRFLIRLVAFKGTAASSPATASFATALFIVAPISLRLEQLP